MAFSNMAFVRTFAPWTFLPWTLLPLLSGRHFLFDVFTLGIFPLGVITVDVFFHLWTLFRGRFLPWTFLPKSASSAVLGVTASIHWPPHTTDKYTIVGHLQKATKIR